MPEQQAPVDNPDPCAQSLWVFAAAMERWFNDCEQFGWQPEIPTTARSILSPGSIALRSTNGHLATYRYSADAQSCTILDRIDAN